MKRQMLKTSTIYSSLLYTIISFAVGIQEINLLSFSLLTGKNTIHAQSDANQTATLDIHCQLDLSNF